MGRSRVASRLRADARPVTCSTDSSFKDGPRGALRAFCGAAPSSEDLPRAEPDARPAVLRAWGRAVSRKRKEPRLWSLLRF